MKKNTEKKEVELADATMFDMLSKKIIASFFRHSLFCRLAVIDWEGQIRGQGDAVLMRDHTKVLVEHAIPIEEERDPAIFKDTTMINMVSKRIAMELRDKVEAEIIKEDDEMALTHDYEILAGRTPQKYVHGRLYFVAGIVPVGGYEPKGYGMKFVYGYKIG